MQQIAKKVKLADGKLLGKKGHAGNSGQGHATSQQQGTYDGRAIHRPITRKFDARHSQGDDDGRLRLEDIKVL